MSNYPIASHSLAFQGDFLALLVKDSSGETVETFSLMNGQGVKLNTVNQDYELSAVESPAFSLVTIDTAKGPVFEFEGARLSGDVIITIRDIGRVSSAWELPLRAEVEFQLDNSPHIFWNEGGPRGFKIEAENEGTYTINFTDPNA